MSSAAPLDPSLRVELLSAMANPQRLAWQAMHQCYSELAVADEEPPPDESAAGEALLRHLLAGGRGHFGPLEHPQIVFNVIGFPHDVMQQARTHRVGVSFDVQCLAETSQITLVGDDGRKRGSMSLGRLAELWRDSPSRVQRLRLRSLDEAENQFVVNRIADVIPSGQKEVLAIELADGKALQCTAKHRVLTVHGWKEAGELGIGDALMVNGRATAHKQRHALAAHAVAITSIEPAGVMTTYDIEMEAPHHNFVADGVVVHNSGRYTSKRVLDVHTGHAQLSDVFYMRPLGPYRDRSGASYTYSEKLRMADYALCFAAVEQYAEKIRIGCSEEHARNVIPYCIRQNFVVSFNARSLMHFLDLRLKLDAQLEIRLMGDLMLAHFRDWMPELAAWYSEKRLGKALLAP